MMVRGELRRPRASRLRASELSRPPASSASQLLAPPSCPETSRASALGISSTRWAWSAARAQLHSWVSVVFERQALPPPPFPLRESQHTPPPPPPPAPRAMQRLIRFARSRACSPRQVTSRETGPRQRAAGFVLQARTLCHARPSSRVRGRAEESSRHRRELARLGPASAHTHKVCPTRCAVSPRKTGKAAVKPPPATSPSSAEMPGRLGCQARRHCRVHPRRLLRLLSSCLTSTSW
ncbi:hypothetical protein CDD83_10592 [Cordyceps sp. RAO-2017]|nr:hypothetical protein CDD83_10592 [Cordyceps sp. RAO-2017]